MAEQQRTEWFGKTTPLQRRTFLKGTAGTAAFLIVQSAFHLDARAQTDLNPGLQYINPDDAATVEALAERIWPATDESPGAIEAGVLFYIDRALAGPYAAFQLQYRTGLDMLDSAAQNQHQNRFANLTPEQQDDLITRIMAGEDVIPTADGAQEEAQEGGQGGEVEAAQTGLEGPFAATSVSQRQAQIAGLLPQPDPGLQGFFNLFRTHTMEGLFSDPIYGGNRDFAGWRAVGYPGAYYVYTEEEQQSFEPLNKPYQSIADL